MKKRPKSKGFKPVTLPLDVTNVLDSLKIRDEQSYADVIKLLIKSYRGMPIQNELRRLLR